MVGQVIAKKPPLPLIDLPAFSLGGRGFPRAVPPPPPSFVMVSISSGNSGKSLSPVSFPNM